MDERAKQAVPKSLIKSLDASLRDLETGAVFDAAGVQAEVWRLYYSELIALSAQR